MTIIISILKWLLIILLALLGLVLVLVACLLFVPARYYVYGAQEESWSLRGNASWLLHILHFSFEVQQGEMKKTFRIFGIPVSLGKKKKKKKQKKKQSRQKQKQGSQQKRSSSNKSDTESRREEEKSFKQIPVEKKEETLSISENSKEKKGIRKYLLSIKALFVKIKKGIVLLARILTEGPSAIVEGTKAEKIITILRDSNTIELWRLIWANLSRLWRHSRPKKIRGRIHFGTSDPCTTGQILGAVGAGCGLIGNSVKIEPDFEEAVLEGYLEIKGRIQVYMLLWILKDVFWSEEWRYFKKQMDQ